MPSSPETSQALSKKLQDLYKTLNKDEQVALRDLLVTTYRGFSSVAIQPLSKKRNPDLDRLNELLTQARAQMGGDQADFAITPTVTTITVTTTVASHPIITCN